MPTIPSLTLALLLHATAAQAELPSPALYIGQWVFNPFETETAPGLLAFAYAQPDERANLGYPDGVAVWNKQVGDWRTIKLWVNDLIGWSSS
jgi:hypothetical protein